MTHTSIRYTYTLEDVLEVQVNDVRRMDRVEEAVIQHAISRYTKDTGKPWPDAPYLRPAVDCSLEGQEYVVEIHQ